MVAENMRVGIALTSRRRDYGSLKNAKVTQTRKMNVRVAFGFRDGDRGTHTSRTIMLAELRHLLSAKPATTSKEGYWNSIIAENVLGKRTGSTRRLSAQRLSELYGLVIAIPLFRVFRTLWDIDDVSRPLLAFLCAYARDPLLRLTTPAVLPLNQGEAVGTADIEAVLIKEVRDRLNPSIRNKVARNAGSSWTQSGHLIGRARKIRSRAAATPVNAAYALFLAYLEGFRGQRLLGSDWAQFLDRSPSEVEELARAAGRRGFINYRSVGDIVEIRFPDWVTSEEEELLLEQN
jgi:hypothetical protein